MVSGNPLSGEMFPASGIIAVETPDGHQSWALIVDAEMRYDQDVSFEGEVGQYTLIARMKPGEMLRIAHTIEPGEENVLVYSRLLVHILREERDRYAELEREQVALRRRARALQQELDALKAERVKELHEAWMNGACNGAQLFTSTSTLADMREACPHPLPEDDEDEETSGCHVCGGPDH